VNRVILVGNLGAAPEVNTTQNGHTMMRLSVATTERIKVQGQWDKKTEWHRVTVFGTHAEGLDKCDIDKGTKVAVEGRLETRRWETQDGQKRSAVNIIADKVELLGGARQQRRAEPATASDNTFDDDDIPF